MTLAQRATKFGKQTTEDVSDTAATNTKDSTVATASSSPTLNPTITLNPVRPLQSIVQSNLSTNNPSCRTPTLPRLDALALHVRSPSAPFQLLYGFPNEFSHRWHLSTDGDVTGHRRPINSTEPQPKTTASRIRTQVALPQHA